MATDIQFFDREKGSLQTEKVAGESAIRFVYENPIGKLLRKTVLIHKPVSQLYGAYQSSALSAGAIGEFIQKFSINMNEYVEGPFHSFNDFFIREFKMGARDFKDQPNILPAFAEGRYFGFESVRTGDRLPVKNVKISVSKLVSEALGGNEFEGGPVLIARLCPVDYHRFHFFDDGKLIREKTLSGPLESVNPIALEKDGDILFKNERHVSLLRTSNFGDVAYVEVGALCVGRIVQNYDREKNFKRGQEKGYFLFGGSTVILVGKPGSFRPSADILKNTMNQIETFVKLGDEVAVKI